MKLHLLDFSIKQIANSGQCFRMKQINQQTWLVKHLCYQLKITELGNNIFEFDCSEQDYNNIWIQYFDLNADYSNFKSKILESQDRYLISAMQYGAGIRILRQDLFEMIISFIISQRNNIRRISNIIKKLCDNQQFLSCENLKQYSLGDLRKIGLGYRAEYIFDFVHSNFDIEYLKTLSYKPAIQYLCTIRGVGEKVANCISLFGLHHLCAFPKDVWINGIIQKYYNGNFDQSKFYEFAGLVQQYMFHYERNRSF